MRNKSPVLPFILKVIKPFYPLIVAQFFVACYWAFDFCMRPYVLKVLLDRVQALSSHTSIHMLIGPALLYILLMLLVILNYRISDYIWLKLNPPLKRHIGMILMERMMNHSQAFFHNHFSGSLANKVKDSMSGIPDLIRLCLNTFISNFFTILASIVTVWTIDYVFAIALSCWIIIFIIGSLFLSNYARTLSSQSAEVRSQAVGNIVDSVSNSINVTLFNGRIFELQRLKKIFDRWVRADQKRDWFFLCMNGTLAFSFVVYQIICILFLILGFKKGSISSGDFVLIFTLNTSIINLLWKLSEEIGRFSDFYGHITQGLRNALEPIEINDAPNAKPLAITQGSIYFNHVHFNYKDTAPLFQDGSLVISGGQKVGLVGYSGSGKSTFIKLILRLYDIQQGQILIDDQNIKNITQESLHGAIGVIPQDPTLFHRSLMENIRYGKLSASDTEVIEAAKKAYAHEFIIEQPHGYETVVGERGVKLSGGQRQRIALARIFLKNAPILMLDEATSQLDSVTEQHIQESLHKLMNTKTTLVIAHRLSTLLTMDRILVFDEGKIVEDGTHQELLAKNGLYFTLWHAQIDGFLPDKK